LNKLELKDLDVITKANIFLKENNLKNKYISEVKSILYRIYSGDPKNYNTLDVDCYLWFENIKISPKTVLGWVECLAYPKHIQDKLRKNYISQEQAKKENTKLRENYFGKIIKFLEEMDLTGWHVNDILFVLDRMARYKSGYYKNPLNIKEQEVFEYLKSQRINPSTAKDYLKQLIDIKHPEIIRLLKGKNSIAKTKLSRKPKRKMDPFEEDELTKLLNAIKSTSSYNKEWFRDYVIIKLCAYLGLRISECLSIKEERINFKKRILTIPAELTKTRTEQSVYLHDMAYKVIQEYIKKYSHKFRQGYLFYSTTQNSYHLKSQGFSRLVRDKYLKLAGLDEIVYTDLRGGKRRRLRLHALRAYFCTKVFRENPNKRLNEIALVTRHKSLDVLNQHYLKINSIDQQKECMENCFNSFKNISPADKIVELQNIIDQQNQIIKSLRNHKEMR